jgi:2-hydroxychromene-2-carboxylate isomerase
MKAVTFWFDPVSPFAYLAFERLPQALEGLSVAVEYRPILFAGLLKHWGQKGPAEIEPKRAWTFRHVHWLAHAHRIALDTPAVHPFNPLPLLRLLIAAGPNRCSCEAVFHHVWQGGADAADRARLAALRERLAPPRDPDGDDVRRELRETTAAAVACGIFGVPTLEVGGRLFWGFDTLPMAAAAIAGDAWFDGPAWEREGAPRAGVERRV